MLVRFTVGNYRSFKERQVFSMAAGKHSRLKNHLVVVNGKRLLKGSVLFGANAAGKSNLIKAINFGKDIINPQIYKISKNICIFMVENKLYLGNGAVWEIANSKYAGKGLDKVEPVIYEYMPEFMQKGLLNREQQIERVVDILKEKYPKIAEDKIKEYLVKEIEEGNIDEVVIKAIGLLKEFKGTIKNCGAVALEEIARLSGINKATAEIIFLQTLIKEIFNGLFVRNNEEAIKNREKALNTSMSTMKQVMKDEYGIELEGYSIKELEEIGNMKEGEGAIVNVKYVKGKESKGHYITVIKRGEDKYSVIDPNVNGGKEVEYSLKGLKEILSGQKEIEKTQQKQ